MLCGVCVTGICINLFDWHQEQLSHSQIPLQHLTRFANTTYSGPEAVGGTGRAQDEVLAAVVLVGVDAHDDDLGVLLDRGQGDGLLGAAIDNLQT